MGAENIIDIEVAVAGETIEIADGPQNLRAVLRRNGTAAGTGPAIARFRSEAIQLSKASDIQDDTGCAGLLLNGTVERVSYPGGIWRHVIHLGNRSVLVDAQQRFEDGTEVRLRIPEDRLYIFPRS